MARNLKGDNSRSKGNKGEDIAVDFLIKSGYEILEVNWAANKAEIDIIAADEDNLVFIEVKTRLSHHAPEEAVTKRKQKLIVSAATQYMESISYDSKIRFDIISIQFQTEEDFKLTHFKDAFFPGLDF